MTVTPFLSCCSCHLCYSTLYEVGIRLFVVDIVVAAAVDDWLWDCSGPSMLILYFWTYSLPSNPVCNNEACLECWLRGKFWSLKGEWDRGRDQGGNGQKYNASKNQTMVGIRGQKTCRKMWLLQMIISSTLKFSLVFIPSPKQSLQILFHSLFQAHLFNKPLLFSCSVALFPLFFNNGRRLGDYHPIPSPLKTWGQSDCVHLEIVVWILDTFYAHIFHSWPILVYSS